ncbi:HD domain-containing phosphohydrolase [Maridesulfovibrio sp.]|uniref:response regulator n=1 Tax=Maridesulfovibrio sp. TaxID=2795000 RepID=UPI002A187468|nr:HD domain-containing phosphohydrolase [Maridesulfovibrio sp.]
MKILAVEDDIIARKRLVKLLESWGHEVLEAGDGRDGFEKFSSEKEPVDIVITDWMMPEINGYELVGMIKNKDTGKPFVYVIFLTGKDSKDDLAMALERAGADDYLTKPFDVHELQARISVGSRMVALEREMTAHSDQLERIVAEQTRIIRHGREELILRLMSSLKYKDGETGNHVRRIGAYCELIAKGLGWNKRRVENCRVASSIHDLGKIGIPDAILKKPGLLTSDEFEVIKTHPQIGSDILEGTEYALIETARIISLHHHEKWDGSGYPQGLSGEDISEEGRVTAIADVFDALSSKRVYRPALPFSRVMEIMDAGRGTHFDPRIYDVFKQHIESVLEISRKYMD